MLGMGKKKKPAGGKHTTPRRAIQFPEDWFLVAQALASEGKAQPTTWYLIDLIRKDAEEKGYRPVPLLPWAQPKGK